MKGTSLIFRSESIFFGLGSSAREVFLEQAFLLQYYMGMTYSDVRNLPIRYRIWFINRVVKEINKTRVTKGAGDNDPGSRSLRGNSRVDSPSRIRRFT